MKDLKKGKPTFKPFRHDARKIEPKGQKEPVTMVKRYTVTERIPSYEIGTNPQKDGTRVTYIRGSSISTKTTHYGNDKMRALRDACPSLREKRLRSCGYTEEEAKEMVSKRSPASVHEREVQDGSDYLRKQRTTKKKIYVTKKKTAVKKLTTVRRKRKTPKHI